MLLSLQLVETKPGPLLELDLLPLQELGLGPLPLRELGLGPLPLRELGLLARRPHEPLREPDLLPLRDLDPVRDRDTQGPPLEGCHQCHHFRHQTTDLGT